jgi:hypothetical protein
MFGQLLLNKNKIITVQHNATQYIRDHQIGDLNKALVLVLPCTWWVGAPQSCQLVRVTTIWAIIIPGPWPSRDGQDFGQGTWESESYYAQRKWGAANNKSLHGIETKWWKGQKHISTTPVVHHRDWRETCMSQSAWCSGSSKSCS